ncbi:MAG: hypothetical protein H0T89_19795 [Deltaproteobacteria bacterium]|nr:hypothetical protein [Deltaproteobacteria bacterium]MDQ3295750.1 hypothetical protein [Myxococcota bacterium]
MMAGRMLLSTAVATALVVSTGCRLSLPTVSKVEVWTPGQRVIVMPLRGTVTDAQVAAVVNDQLRRLGDVDVLAPAPSNVPVPSGDPHEACMQARNLGADYVVVTSADISVLDNRVCLVGTNLLSKIVLPLPIPIPWLNKIAVVDVPLASPDKCLASVEIGDGWSVTVNAQVFTTELCLATGGQFTIERGTDRTVPDGVALQAKIENKTADLFPARATITRLDGQRGLVDAPRNMQVGDLYEVRNVPSAQGSLAYVHRVDARQAVVEPYAPTDELRTGDLLLRRGKPQWMELLVYGASGQILVGGDRHLASGAGALFRGQLGALSIGLTAEYLRILDGDTRRDTDTTSTFKSGLQGGVHRHVSTHLDLYGTLELGYSAALGIPLDGDDRVPYGGMFAGARFALGKWFAGLELGGMYSGMQHWDGRASVGQRGAAARFTLGRNFRPNLGMGRAAN